MPVPTKKLVEQIVEIADAKKAENITTLNISKDSSIADYFVIFEGLSTSHVSALAKYLIDELKKLGSKPVRTSGFEDKEWIILDYSDVLVHILMPHIRERFRLEDLWRKTTKGKDTSS